MASEPADLHEDTRLAQHADDENRSRILQSVGLDKPESCSFVLEILKSAHSKNPEKRLIAVAQLEQCFQHLRSKGEDQILLDLAVFSLERGIVRTIACEMREAQSGDWTLRVEQRKIDLKSKSKSKVKANKPVVLLHCLISLSIDTRCVAFILKEFPDLVEVLSAIFIAEPHLGRINRHQAYKFQIHARGEAVHLLNHLMPRSRGCNKRVAEETGLLRGILKYAARLENGTKRIYAETHFACLALVCGAAASEKADLWALRSDLYELIGHILASVKSREQVDLARRLLCATMKADLEDNILSQYSSIGSSLLAMRSVGDRMGAETWDCVVNHAVRQFWREGLQDLSSNAAESYLDERFRADEKAVRRAVQLGKMFSAPSEETCQTFYVEKPRSKQRTAETEPAEVGAASVPVKPRLERRKCSHSSCGNVESVGGTFQICGRCRLAVYCSKGEYHESCLNIRRAIEDILSARPARLNCNGLDCPEEFLQFQGRTSETPFLCERTDN